MTTARSSFHDLVESEPYHSCGESGPAWTLLRLEINHEPWAEFKELWVIWGLWGRRLSRQRPFSLPFGILIPTSIDFICLAHFPMKMRISCHFTTLGRSISRFLVIDHRLESFHELLSKFQALWASALEGLEPILAYELAHGPHRMRDKLGPYYRYDIAPWIW